MIHRLRNSQEFRAVYEGGRRFDARFMTVFILANDFEFHRFGVTASRRMSRLSVERNRAKRLLRESFRLNQTHLSSLRAKYDWVFNARRSLLDVKVDAVVEELKKIIIQVGVLEKESLGRV